MFKSIDEIYLFLLTSTIYNFKPFTNNIVVWELGEELYCEATIENGIIISLTQIFLEEEITAATKFSYKKTNKYDIPDEDWIEL